MLRVTVPVCAWVSCSPVCLWILEGSSGWCSVLSCDSSVLVLVSRCVVAVGLRLCWVLCLNAMFGVMWVVSLWSVMLMTLCLNADRVLLVLIPWVNLVKMTLCLVVLRHGNWGVAMWVFVVW